MLAFPNEGRGAKLDLKIRSICTDHFQNWYSLSAAPLLHSNFGGGGLSYAQM